MRLTAREQDVATQATAAKALPVAEVVNFSFSDDGGDALSRSFKYATRKHEFRDVLRVGYFDAVARDFGLRPWDEIHVTAGVDPSDATRAVLRVIKVPTIGRISRTQRLASSASVEEEHLRLAIVARWKPTAVMHDGSDEADSGRRG